MSNLLNIGRAGIGTEIVSYGLGGGGDDEAPTLIAAACFAGPVQTNEILTGSVVNGVSLSGPVMTNVTMTGEAECCCP